MSTNGGGGTRAPTKLIAPVWGCFVLFDSDVIYYIAVLVTVCNQLSCLCISCSVGFVDIYRICEFTLVMNILPFVRMDAMEIYWGRRLCGMTLKKGSVFFLESVDSIRNKYLNIDCQLNVKLSINRV